MAALSNKRTGRVTSSEIVALTTNGTSPMSEEELKQYKIDNPKGTRKTKDDYGAPFYTYVEECIMERFFAQRLENDVDVLAMSWGKLCENIVHHELSFDYIFQSDKTYVHKLYPDWVGTPDGTKLSRKKVDTVTDIKCPLTRKAFFNLVRDLYDFDGVKVKRKKIVDWAGVIQAIRKRSKEGEKYYWQLVSNACILGAKYAELIVFMPYKEELESIRLFNSKMDVPNYLVGRATDGELPYIYKERGIKNINVIRFEVPQADKDFLTDRVKAAIDLIYA